MTNQDRTAQSGLLQADHNPNPWQDGNPDNPNQQPQPSSGPQFTMEPRGGWGKRLRDWLRKHGSSVVLPIIALLILAGGIYLYASQRGEEVQLSLEEAVTEETTEDFGLDESITPPEQTTETSDQTIQTGDQQKQVEQIIPEGRKEEGKIIEKAARGDGVTHLARRALKDYLKDNPQTQELTNEHKIYIEDYLKDRTGSRPLEIGQEISFSEDLIQEAIDASLQLTDSQLKNLEKYSALVAWD